jgi:hypothetical protein
MAYDVIVIGGGPSGLMASYSAGLHGAKVLLLDKGDRLGRKLAISGGGRCNVTNAGPLDKIIEHIPGNGRFLYSALSAFGNREIIAFFERLGIRLKEEDNGRMFPVTDRAQTVVNALVSEVRRQGVEIQVNSPVDRIVYRNGRTAAVRLMHGHEIPGRCVVLATGGKSVPHTGSTGDGYAWAEEAGHTITELFPTEVPITSGEPFIQRRELQGLSLRGVVLSVWNAGGKKVVSHEGDLLFTHFGLSGPAALRCSHFVVKQLRRRGEPKVILTIDLFPGLSADEVYARCRKLAAGEPKKAAKNVLKALLPERMIPLLLAKTGIAEELAAGSVSKPLWMELARLLKAFPVECNGTLSIREAFVTGGGVHLKEVDPKTMQSKLMEGLFFCGEILDVHGYTGGYNITAAFATGYSAGKHAALAARGAPASADN